MNKQKADGKSSNKLVKIKNIYDVPLLVMDACDIIDVKTVLEDYYYEGNEGWWENIAFFAHLENGKEIAHLYSRGSDPIEYVLSDDINNTIDNYCDENGFDIEDIDGKVWIVDLANVKMRRGKDIGDCLPCFLLDVWGFYYEADNWEPIEADPKELEDPEYYERWKDMFTNSLFRLSRPFCGEGEPTMFYVDSDGKVYDYEKMDKSIFVAKDRNVFAQLCCMNKGYTVNRPTIRMVEHTTMDENGEIIITFEMEQTLDETEQ